MDDSWATWINLGILAVSAASALWAARSAKKSSKAEQSSQQIAKQQAQLGYVEMVRGWRPAVAMELTEVHYRWATNRFMLYHKGEATNPGVATDETITIDQGEEKGIGVEIVTKGRLVNKTSEQMLITVKPGRDGGWRPAYNECLFIVDEKDSSRFILAPEGEIRFTWIDRKSLNEWRAIHHATNEDAKKIDRDFEMRSERLSPWRRMLGKRETSYLDWSAHERSQAGFAVVADSRMATRVSTIWYVEPRQSAITPAPVDSDSKPIGWKLQPSVAGPIDDDVMEYRCFHNSALAQLEMPRVIHLPGRF